MSIKFNSLINDKQKECCIISNDAGGAEILSRLSKTFSINKNYILSGPAKKIFNEKSNIQKFDTLLKKIDLLICSTSMYNNKYYEAIQKANDAGVYTVILLDHWNFFKKRIQNNINDSLPDLVIVLDIEAKNILRSYFPKLNIKIIKNLYLNELVSKVKKIKIDKNNDYINILYCSEYMKLFHSSAKESYSYYGYNEFDAIIFFFENIQYLFKKKINITLRTHPGEPKNKYNQIIKKYKDIKIKINRKASLFHQIANNDVIVGCETFPMVIAYKCKKIVLSSIPVNGRQSSLPYKGILYIRDLIRKKEINIELSPQYIFWEKVALNKKILKN